MRPLRLRRTLGVKLGLAFAGVLVVMLASLGLVLVKSSEASHAYERALGWKTAVDGAARQAAGTRQQQASQALYVATGEERYKQEWEAGVAISDKAGAAVDALHDPTVSRIAAAATAADHKHDDTVHKQLFPAMQRGDMVAAKAALLLADKYVRVPLRRAGEDRRLRQPAPAGGRASRRRGRLGRAQGRHHRGPAGDADGDRDRGVGQPQDPPRRQRGARPA